MGAERRGVFWRGVWMCGAAAAALAPAAVSAQEAGLRGTFPLGTAARAQQGGLLAASPLDSSPLTDAILLLRRRGEVPADIPYDPATESDAATEAERLDSRAGGGSGDSLAGDGSLIERPGLREVEDTAEATPPPSSQGARRTASAAGGKNQARLTPGTGRTPVASSADPRTTGGISPRGGQTAGMLKAVRAVPEGAVQSRSVPDLENPFEAPGVRFGSLTLRPTLEQGIEQTYTSGGGTASRSATTSVTTLRGEIESDWRRGSLEGSGFVTFREPLAGDSGTGGTPEAGLSLRLVNPLGRDWQTEAGLNWGMKEESAFTAVPLPGTITDRPLAHSFTANAGVSRIDGFLRPGFRLEIDRDVYGDAVDSLGTVISQSDRDETALRGSARLGFAVSPALTPFIEAGYGRRWRDEEVDSGGLRRSGDELRGSVGVAFNASEKFNGEVSVGWIRQGFDDPALADVEGLALAGALNWSPQRGTTVNAGLTTTTDGGGGAGGSVLYSGTLGVTQQVTSQLTATATLGAALRDFTATGETDTTLSAEAVATWWFNRTVGINARARHEMVGSADPTRDQDTTTLSIGLRLQR